MFIPMLSLKFFVYSKQHSALSDKRLKTTGKSSNFQAQNVVAVAYWRCGRLLEVPTVRLFDWESFGGLDRRSLMRRGRLLEIPTLRVLVFWIGGRLWEVVAYGRWSLTGGGRTRRFDCIYIFKKAKKVYQKDCLDSRFPLRPGYSVHKILSNEPKHKRIAD